jgi:hypothetical protein
MAAAIAQAGKVTKTGRPLSASTVAQHLQRLGLAAA